MALPKDYLYFLNDSRAKVLITTSDLAPAFSKISNDLKKRGTFIRMKFRKFLGKPNPDFGYTLKGFSFARHLMEIIIGAMFMILGTRFARFLIELIPPQTVGKIFERARTIWKKSTHNLKRENLN